MKKAFLYTIKVYQKAWPVRFIISKVFLPVSSACRYAPTCSEYTVQAVEKYGVLKGLFLGGKRFLSCNPFGGHGYKPLT